MRMGVGCAWRWTRRVRFRWRGLLVRLGDAARAETAELRDAVVVLAKGALEMADVEGAADARAATKLRKGKLNTRAVRLNRVS